MEGERRLLTILFCDVAGSTALAEQLDPEEWAEIMSSAFRYLIEPVLRYEGTLSRLMGDAILAYFGAPAAHEDDPQRAVLAALDIHSGLESFRREIAQDYGLDFNVRTGIHTGPVVMLEVGAGEAAEYTAMGDAVNLAARIEQSADPGTIRISEDTYRLIAPLFECEPLGTVEVKGKREPVPVYRVLGRKDPASRRGPGCELSPFAGRQAELQRLQEALDRLLRTGQGGLVFIRGEAGLGKSRLIEELRQRITEAAGPEEPGAAPQVAWVESRAVSYDTQRPYGLFLHLLRQACGVDQNDPPEVMQSKIMQAIDQNSSAQDEDHRRHMRRAVEMLLLSANQRPAQDPVLEGEALKREIFSVVQQSVRMSASQHALVLVIEDMHWLDPASTGLLEELFLLAEELPILYLCALRPLYVSPGWHALEYARRRCARMLQEIELQPLPAGETQALLDSLVQDSEISPGLRKALLQRAEAIRSSWRSWCGNTAWTQGGAAACAAFPTTCTRCSPPASTAWSQQHAACCSLLQSPAAPSTPTCWPGSATIPARCRRSLKSCRTWVFCGGLRKPAPASWPFNTSCCARRRMNPSCTASAAAIICAWGKRWKACRARRSKTSPTGWRTTFWKVATTNAP